MNLASLLEKCGILSRIDFLNENVTIDLPSGQDFLEVKEKFPEMPIVFGCRKGECGRCCIQVIEGHDNLTKRTPEEVATLKRLSLGNECRLACQCAVNGDVKIGRKE